MSTVSGGGYIGASLTAAMSAGDQGKFPFEDETVDIADISDSAAVSRLRNYSNYLFPRDRSNIRNWLDVSSILLRGLIANFVSVFSFVMFLALVTYFAFGAWSNVEAGGFAWRLAVNSLAAIDGLGIEKLAKWTAISAIVAIVAIVCFALIRFAPLPSSMIAPPRPQSMGQAIARCSALLASSGIVAIVFGAIWLLETMGFRVIGSSWSALTAWARDTQPERFAWIASIAFVIMLLLWAMLRSWPRFEDIVKSRIFVSDTEGLALGAVRVALAIVLAILALELQPVAMRALESIQLDQSFGDARTRVLAFFASFGGLGAVVSFFGGMLGRFLENSKHATDLSTVLRRIAAKALIFVAALVLPILIWLLYLYLSIWLLKPYWTVLPGQQWTIDALQTLNLYQPPAAVALAYGTTLFVASFAVAMCLRGNGYSLHRFYRDRLHQAFLVRTDGEKLEPFHDNHLKLSSLKPEAGPYPIVNAALNVQGSAEANRRGRNADFFIFTPHFVGSDLTRYAPTREMLFGTSDIETLDPRIDLATAMAISGAAVSANMGGQTMRLLSPTLALLNIRLGYWLRNPRRFRTNIGPAGLLRKLMSRFYLLLEMTNRLDEKSDELYLTDGGHIENLGIYELLKRGCKCIVAIDAEADPEMAFSSLLQLERFARIDLGVRIELPWPEIARANARVSESVRAGSPVNGNGPHCAVGTIRYPDGRTGILVYFKSSLTGDERDYVLDYKKRHSAFPHETTGDQFFSEEQFEVYRALGFHMVHEFFSGKALFACNYDRDFGFRSRQHAFEEVRKALGLPDGETRAG